MSKLLEILKIESQEIATSFAKASIEGEGTPQEVSDRREDIIHNFLEIFFPFPFRIVKGNITAVGLIDIPDEKELLEMMEEIRKSA